MASPVKYTQRDKARILKITTRTLQRWRYTKPELFAIIEAGFKMLEKLQNEDVYHQEIQELIRKLDQAPITRQ
ncbi:hypothetical protein [Helicobacter cynogastricus]|uniref:hypothetical protein n=1 Tax=Helicobacter cynogastricus TaxID=329937 RepID=UPI000CF16A28|nr:hypothetical protein [Helicobacter cynogastricus]